MFGLFAPQYVKEARDLLKNADKLLSYKRDAWSETTVADFESQIEKLKQAIKDENRILIEQEGTRLDEMAAKYSPPPKDAAIRENCEVLLVAIIIALAVRSYFLQPFAIPTGSMQPTLNGIIGYKMTTEPPNLLVRVADGVLHGRSYFDVVCKQDGEIGNIQEYQRFHFFTRTIFDCGGVTYTVNMPSATLMNYFGVNAGMVFQKGQPILRGYVEAGDHVFVDKFTYNFRLPQHGDVFVFNTAGIPTYDNRTQPEAASQFYIKRVGGLPGDELRIDPPILYQNGVKASAPGYQPIMNMAPGSGYFGYQNGAKDAFGNIHPMSYLTDPDSKFNVPAKRYFALGDNNFHSSDSRDWGTVPQRNIVGRGLFVFWPFLPHWGFIH